MLSRDISLVVILRALFVLMGMVVPDNAFCWTAVAKNIDANGSVEEIVIPLDPMAPGAIDSSAVSPNSSGPGTENPAIPGWEFRTVLARLIPNVDFFIEELVDHVDNVTVSHDKGKMVVDIRLAAPVVTARLDDKDSQKVAAKQIYGVRFMRDIHFEISAVESNISIAKIKGVAVLVNLPFFPDAIYPKRVRFETSTQMLKIWVRVAGGTASVDAKFDLGMKKYVGVDWISSILHSIGVSR